MQTFKSQIRRQLQKDLPRLAPGEMGFCVDTLRLYIGSDSYANGSPWIGNIEIYTDVSRDYLKSLFNNTVTLLGNILSPIPSGIIMPISLSSIGYWNYIITKGNQENIGTISFALNNGVVNWSNDVTGPDLGISLSVSLRGLNLSLDYTSINAGNATLQISFMNYL